MEDERTILYVQSGKILRDDGNPLCHSRQNFYSKMRKESVR
jgi:hypothetical protein